MEGKVPLERILTGGGLRRVDEAATAGPLLVIPQTFKSASSLAGLLEQPVGRAPISPPIKGT